MWWNKCSIWCVVFGIWDGGDDDDDDGGDDDDDDGDDDNGDNNVKSQNDSGIRRNF